MYSSACTEIVAEQGKIDGGRACLAAERRNSQVSGCRGVAAAGWKLKFRAEFSRMSTKKCFLMYEYQYVGVRSREKVQGTRTGMWYCCIVCDMINIVPEPRTKNKNKWLEKRGGFNHCVRSHVPV